MLDKKVLEEVLVFALQQGGDFAEIFLEDTLNTSLKMVSGKVENGTSGREYGIGIRIFRGTNSVYAYSNIVSRDNLLRIVEKAAEALQGSPQDVALDLTRKEYQNINQIKTYPQDVDKKRKVAVMRRAHEAAFNYSDLITQVRINYLDHNQNVLIANSEGLFVEDQRVRTRLFISAVASRGQEKQTGFYGPGASMGFEFYDTIDVEEYAREAARTADTMIKADFCPSGKMPVIIDNEFGGVIFHEACGHGLEATSVAKGTSVFADKIGEQVGSKLVTAVDDGTIPNAWGSSTVDDEGTPTRKNILIEDGILKGYMIDRLNGRRMGMEPTGNARRQSYQFAPTSRMTNTYIADGDSSLNEMIAETEYGLYARYMGGGSVNPATGDFNFAVNEGYIVKDGKIDRPVRGATLIGRGIEVLKKIDMVGNNLDLGQGMCGSVSGSIPANVGQPAIRVSELTVGGRKGDE